jgi:dUTP pyrophosphatase
MNRIAKFEKVSYKQFKNDWIDKMGYYTEKFIKDIYNNIQLPRRSTTGSAGYDFFAPSNLSILSNDYLTIPTGIRCKIDDGWVLTAYPRSGHGFKYGIKLANTVGVIDSDYYNAKNEGHIFVKLVNESVVGEHKDFSVNSGDAIFQGIFLPFGITVDDNADGKRTVGFGSTDKK